MKRTMILAAVATAAASQAQVFLRDTFTATPARPEGTWIHNTAVETSSIGSRTWWAPTDPFNQINAKPAISQNRLNARNGLDPMNGYARSFMQTPFSLADAPSTNLIQFGANVRGGDWGGVGGSLGVAFGTGVLHGQFERTYSLTLDNSGQVLNLEGFGASTSVNLATSIWRTDGSLTRLDMVLDRSEKKLHAYVDNTLVTSLLIPNFDESHVQWVGLSQRDWLSTALYDDFEVRSAVVPEPASMVALGFGGLAVLLRRKRA